MCGITGIISKAKDNNVTLTNDLYVSLMNIQHRGQDSCGYLINNDNENTIFKGTIYSTVASCNQELLEFVQMIIDE